MYRHSSIPVSFLSFKSISEINKIMESDLPFGKTTLILGDPSKDLSLANENVGVASKKIKDLSTKYESMSKEVKRLTELQQDQSHAALTAVSADGEYKELTDFKPVKTDKGNIIGFTYKYENNDISVTMIVRYNTEEKELFAQTFIDDFKTRINKLTGAPTTFKNNPNPRLRSEPITYLTDHICHPTRFGPELATVLMKLDEVRCKMKLSVWTR